ncbi:gamma-interferon-inducible protein 16-like isoform X1 [Nycticebus coucang]|uniref:gamma-interferon-inducible protein 16-like isoform X1 n=1 Tax=Nycticebus coucang TaxID=9470 RepID=UPI00234C3777|nr:gamma-interferon-inducible protein 16-like isoform X1 [Nycticebus coucang]XP_053462704.1 gamma-interferon-inducible protein 16-like isoform X1 [Nycticebus coucang]
MANECWKIILIKGLEEINDDQFKMVKFLLTDPLKLTSKMQDECGKVQFANLMIKKFPEDAGVDKLMKLCKEIASLQAFVEILKREKAKVMKRRSTPAKGKPPSKKNKQDEDSPAAPVPSTSNTVTSEGAEVTPGPQEEDVQGADSASLSHRSGHAHSHQPSLTSQTSSAPANMPSIEKPKTQAKPQVNTRANHLQKGPMTVMVLSTTEPFEYESSEKEKKTMFHATVATERKFFHMKVLDINLKTYISRDKIIAVSDYLEYDHLLEVNEASSVSEAGPEQKLEVPVNIINRAQETLKIDVLQTQASGTVVYGLFMLQKKTVNKNNTVYEINDDTGNIEVVGKGKCHNIPCEKGDKLELICFRLRKKNRLSQLISEIHSFIQVKPKAKQRKYDSKTVNLLTVQSMVANPSVASTTPDVTQSHTMTPQMQCGSHPFSGQHNPSSHSKESRDSSDAECGSQPFSGQHNPSSHAKESNDSSDAECGSQLFSGQHNPSSQAEACYDSSDASNNLIQQFLN